MSGVLTSGARRLGVGAFNIHGGVDGWGRPFDPLPGCLALEADVLLLAECFNSDAAPTFTQRLSAEHGYEVAAEARLGRVEMLEPPRALAPFLARRWGPGGAQAPGMRLVHDTRPPRRPARWPVRERGTWSVVLLSRLPVRSAKVLPLTPLSRDPVRRVLLSAEVEVDGAVVGVVGTHFPHLSDGSFLRFGELRRALFDPPMPGVLLGDMNCFGPPLSLALPGWRRAVVGRSWPAWRPICQPDHIFVNRAVQRTSGEVMSPAGSDHLAVRASLWF